jgi:[acyl-carrier-protein] S-malonyltransferase
MQQVLSGLEFASLNYPLVNNADVATLTNKDDVREGLVKQVVSPVRWLEIMEDLVEKGVDTFVEVGPGRVLSGLLKRTARGATLLNVEDVTSLEKTVTALKG